MDLYRGSKSQEGVGGEESAALQFLSPSHRCTGLPSHDALAQ